MTDESTVPMVRVFATVATPGFHEVITEVGSFTFWNGAGSAPLELARAMVAAGLARAPELDLAAATQEPTQKVTEEA